jgi:hypothetical protein
MTAAVAHAHHENPHAGQGPVVLDIGGKVGALVVAMPDALAGVEIEIRSLAGGTHCSHVGVVGRPVGDHVVWSAVFPELHEGRYELYERLDGRPQLVVEVFGGEVTQASWPR